VQRAIRILLTLFVLSIIGCRSSIAETPAPESVEMPRATATIAQPAATPSPPPTATAAADDTVTAATDTGPQAELPADDSLASSIISLTTADQSASQDVELPPVDPLEVKGNIRLTGSQTVLPLVEIVYQDFVQNGYAGEVQSSSIGTERGLQLLCDGGDIDLITASHRMSPELVDACSAQNRPPIEFQIGTDAVTVVISANNNFATEITRAELATLFTAERWSDVNPTWPGEPIQRYIPPVDSVTFGFLVDTVLAGNAAALLNAPNLHQNIDFLNVTDNVADDPYGVGFMGYVYYAPYQRSNNLKALLIDGIEITPETVSAGVYPLTRPLFFYSSLTILAQKPQVVEFLNFFLTNVETLLPQHDYFTLAPDALNRSKSRLLEVILGEIAVAAPPLLSSVTQAMITPLEETGYQGDIRHTVAPSNEGFRRLCQDWDVDLVASSRKIRLEEIISCTVSERIPLEFPIGNDALTVVVNPANRFVQDVTLAELAALFSAERWSDVRPGWPNTPIERFIPDPDSGEFAIFAQTVLAGDATPMLQAARTIPTRDDAIIARSVANTTNGLGLVPHRIYRQNSNVLLSVKLDGVEPSAETMVDGSYPLTLDLFLYSAESVLQQKPQVAAYVNSFLMHLNRENERLGHFPANSRVLNTSRGKLLETILTPD